MKAKKNLFSSLLAAFLIIVILGGTGYLGYNFMFGAGGMNMASSTTPNNNQNGNGLPRHLRF